MLQSAHGQITTIAGVANGRNALQSGQKLVHRAVVFPNHKYAIREVLTKAREEHSQGINVCLSVIGVVGTVQSYVFRVIECIR